MSRGQNVEFQNIDDIVDAYEKWQVPAFAIWCKNQFEFRYCGEGISIEGGAAFLRELLERFKRNVNAAIYTLCVYDDIEEDEMIVSNTPYSGSFNFRLTSNPIGYLPPEIYHQYGGNAHAMYEEMQQLRAKVKELEEKGNDDDDDDDELSVGDKIGKALIENLETLLPAITAGLGAKIGDWLNPAAKTATISGIEVNDSDVSDSLNRLLAVDPEFPAVLNQLALLAEKRNSQYKFYRNMLMKMKF